MKKIFSVLFCLLACGFFQTSHADINVSSYKIMPRTIPKNGVRIPFLKVRVSALDENIWISGFKVQRGGLSSSEDFGRIWAETEDGFKSYKRTLTNDDVAELKFRKSIKIQEGQSQIFQIYANLNIEGNGRTVSLSLNDILIPAFAEKPITQKIKEATPIPEKKGPKIYCKNQKCYRLR